MILSKAHVGVVGGPYAGKATMRNILQAGLWWPTLHAYARDYCRSYDIYQRMGKPSQRDEIPLVLHIALHELDKWDVDFVGPTSPARKCMRVRYIITATNYLTRWEEFESVKDCTAATSAKFLFENVVTRFRCPKILISD